MSFGGFPDEGLVFYEGLEADNSRAHWGRHRDVWERAVRAPVQALLDELAPEFGVPKLFRPYRDVRFSKDKTPYKTHQGAVVPAPGGGAGAWYLQLSADGLFVAGGAWRLEPDQVARYRRAVADRVQGPRLQGEVDRLGGAGWSIEGDRLVRMPAGFPADAERGALLRHRSLHAGRRWVPADWLHERVALERVRSSWLEVAGLVEWFDTNVGASTREGATHS